MKEHDFIGELGSYVERPQYAEAKAALEDAVGAAPRGGDAGRPGRSVRLQDARREFAKVRLQLDRRWKDYIDRIEARYGPVAALALAASLLKYNEKQEAV